MFHLMFTFSSTGPFLNQVFGELPLHQCTSLRVSVVQDMCAVRAYGRSLNDLKALTRRLDCERRSDLAPREATCLVGFSEKLLVAPGY